MSGEELEDRPAAYESGTLVFSHDWAEESVWVWEYEGRFYVYASEPDSLTACRPGDEFATLDEAIVAVAGLQLTDASAAIVWESHSVAEVLDRLEYFNNEPVDLLINGVCTSVVRTL